MTTSPLRLMLDEASEWSVMRFAKTGEINPMWLIVDGNGEVIVRAGMMENKDSEAVLMRAYFLVVRARRFLFVDEAWIGVAVAGNDAEYERLQRYAALGRLADHPDRREAVMFAGEDIDGDRVLAQRYILRPEHGKAKLAPLEIVHEGKQPLENSYGRFVNMLPPRAEQ
jgi:hypothetical protein